MSKQIRTVAIVGACILALGIIVGLAGFMHGGYKPLSIGLDGVRVYSDADLSSYDVLDETYASFGSIEVDTSTIPVTLQEGTEFSVTGKNLKSNGGLKAAASGGILKVSSQKPSVRAFSFGPFGYGSQSRLVITWPAGAKFESVSIRDDVGSLRIEGLNAQDFYSSVDTGEQRISGSSLGRMKTTMNLGSLTIADTSVNTADIGQDSGSANISGFSSQGLTMNNDLGSISIEGTLHGASKVKCDTGSINIRLNQSIGDISYSVSSDVGSAKVVGGNGATGYPKVQITGSPDSISAESNVGSVTITCLK